MTLLALFCVITAVAQFDTTSVGNKSFISWVLEESTLELDTFLLGDKSYVRVAGPFALDSLVDSKAFYSIVAGETEASSPFVCGTSSVTFDGHDYSTVQIGDQCWFAENLRTTEYADGTNIPEVTDNSAWGGLSAGGRCSYDNDASNLETYGYLYNWYAVDDSRGLCPNGWHVPTDGEWMTLEMELGMSESEAYSTGHRGTDQGTQMKSSASDTPSWNGSNTSGFSALPGGLRDSGNGDFYNEGGSGFWWSASPSGLSGAWYRLLASGIYNVYRANGYQRCGFSVRCVRDE